MSRDFPAHADPMDLVQARREFEGTWPLARFERAADLLASDEGELHFRLAFDRDEIGTPYVDVELSGAPILMCQRTMAPFAFELQRHSRLGLIAHEREEAALPEGYEPLLLGSEPIGLMDIVEDELILAIPLVPKAPGEAVDTTFGDADEAEEEQARPSPFAALEALKTKN